MDRLTQLCKAAGYIEPLGGFAGTAQYYAANATYALEQEWTPVEEIQRLAVQRAAITDSETRSRDWSCSVQKPEKQS